MNEFKYGSIPYNTTLFPLMSQFTGPPYSFADTTFHVFPLPANPIQLGAFVDTYLNHLPEVAYFRPLGPFVLVSVMSYGQQSQSPESGGTPFGFISQNQISFTIPMLHFSNKKTLKLKGLAAVNPFVFASDPLSVVNGRLIFGFQNRVGWLKPPAQSWEIDPSAPNRVLELEAKIMRDLWMGRRPKPYPVLEIDYCRSKGHLQFLKNLPNPLTRFSDFITAVSRNAIHLSEFPTWFISSGGFFRIAQLLKYFIQNTFLGITRYPSRLGPPTTLISLKQFRDAEQQDNICYQSILASDMITTRVQNFELLGLSDVMAGDPSGGYTLYCRVYEEFPVFNLLGIVPDKLREDVKDWKGTKITTGERPNTSLDPAPPPPSLSPPNKEPTLAVLKPFFPMSFTGDLCLEPSRRLAWRLRDTGWLIPSAGQTTDPPDDGGVALQIGAKEPQGNTYNQATGVADGSYNGPYKFSNTTIRVLPLKADPNKLKEFLKNYLGFVEYKEHHHEFKVDGEFVFALIADFGDMISETDNVGNWAGTTLQFLIPVKWTCDGEEICRPVVAPYSFSSSEINTLIQNETYGFFYHMADFVKPSNTWIRQPHGQNELQPLLHLWTSVYPSQTLSAFPRPFVLLEVLGRNAHPKEPDSSGLPPDPFSKIYKMHLVDNIKNDSKFYFDQLTLKQFRGAGLENSAVYQAIVEVPRSMTDWHFADNDEDILLPETRIRIHDNPQFPLVQTLGLVYEKAEIAKSEHPNHIWQGQLTYVLKAEYPFWFNASIEIGEARNICWRADGHEEWKSLKVHSKSQRAPLPRSLLGSQKSPVSREKSPTFIFFDEQKDKNAKKT